MNFEANDISHYRLEEKEKALMASFATSADALLLIPGSAEYDAYLQKHRKTHEHRSQPDFGLINEALHQKGLLTFISDPSWNSISRDLEGAKKCCGVDFERLIIALKSFYALNMVPDEHFVVYEGGIGAGCVLEEMASSSVEAMIMERRVRVCDALYVGVSDTLFGNLYAILEKALAPAFCETEEATEFIRYFMQSVRNYCHPPFQNAEHERHAQNIIHARTIDELFLHGRNAIPEDAHDVQLRQRGVEPLTDEHLQSPGMRLLYQFKTVELPTLFDGAVIHSPIASFAIVYPQRFIQGDFRELDTLPTFQADARIHIRALMDLTDNEYADYLLYSIDHLHPGGIIEDDAPKTRGLHKPRLKRFLEKLSTHSVPANLFFVTKKISGALDSVLIQRKCEYADHEVPYPYMTIEDIRKMGVVYPTHAIVTPDYYNRHGGIAHVKAKDRLIAIAGEIRNVEEMHVDMLEIAVGKQFMSSTLRRLEEEAQQPLTTEDAQEGIGAFLGGTEYDVLKQVVEQSCVLDARDYPYLRFQME